MIAVVCARVGLSLAAVRQGFALPPGCAQHRAASVPILFDALPAPCAEPNLRQSTLRERSSESRAPPQGQTGARASQVRLPHCPTCELTRQPRLRHTVSRKIAAAQQQRRPDSPRCSDNRLRDIASAEI